MAVSQLWDIKFDMQYKFYENNEHVNYKYYNSNVLYFNSAYM